MSPYPGNYPSQDINYSTGFRGQKDQPLKDRKLFLRRKQIEISYDNRQKALNPPAGKPNQMRGLKPKKVLERDGNINMTQMGDIVYVITI